MARIVLERCAWPIEVTDGYLVCPTAPGLRAVLDEDAIAWGLVDRVEVRS